MRRRKQARLFLVPTTYARTRSNRRAISSFGCTPIMRSISRPALSVSRVGMLWALKRAAVAGFSSTLSFATRTRPAISPANSSNIGAIVRQGPHHGAHKSSSTGSGERMTSASRVASVTVIGLFKGAEESCTDHSEAAALERSFPSGRDSATRKTDIESWPSQHWVWHGLDVDIWVIDKVPHQCTIERVGTRNGYYITVPSERESTRQGCTRRCRIELFGL